MARIRYLLRRDASYYARIKVPTDLVDNGIADQLASAGDSFEKAFRKLSPDSYKPKTNG